MSRPDPQTDPTTYVLAVADQREQRTKASADADGGPWNVDPNRWGPRPGHIGVRAAASPVAYCDSELHAEHIAAEANPEHALAEVALWRGIAERHRKLESGTVGNLPWCDWCDAPTTWPCPDLLGVVAAAKAYAGAP